MQESPETSRTEDDIRDHLARHLSLIEAGLSLIEKEKFLHNDKGAKGFVDIFARSMSGQLVIIEIKRSDAAARQAVQEIIKYAALLKQNLLVKETEVRLIVASTNWHELLVPFSEFVHATRYACEGRYIILGTDGLPQATEVVELVPAEQPRRICRRHFIWGFDDETAARAAIPVLAAYLEKVGLKDFVVVLLAIRGSHDKKRRFLYFAQQELSFEVYMALIRKRFPAEAVAEFEDYLNDLTEDEDKISVAADKVWEDVSFEDSIYGRMHATHAQIAHPEKARYWFDQTTLISLEIVRFGRFVSSNLSDDIIITEIIGDGGESFHHGNVRADLASKPEIDALLGVSDNLFFFNPIWRTAVRDLCDYARKTAALSVHLRAFSNDDILRTLAGLAIGYPDYLPSFALDIKRAEGVESYVGVIEWSGRTTDFVRLMTDHFGGNDFNYFMACHFGDNRRQNADLMTDLGLAYNFARPAPTGPVTVRVRGALVSDARGGGQKTIVTFLQENPAFLDRLVKLFLQHEQAFGQIFERFAFASAEASLEVPKTHSSDAKVTYWIGDVDACDICKRDLLSARFMVDGSVQGKAGACMCALCFQRFGTRIAWGHAQLYEKNPCGWLLVGGGPPPDGGDETARSNN